MTASRSGGTGAEPALVVTLRTHGGLAAGVALARAPRVVDTRRLSPGEGARLRRLLATVRAEGPGGAGGVTASADAGPAGGGGPGTPAPRAAGSPADASGYTVTVQTVPPGGGGGEGGGGEVLTATDLTLTDAFADLVDWIEEHAEAPA